MRTHNGELPKNFKSWLQLYREVTKNGLQEESTFVIALADDPTDPHPEFDIWYIKSKALDELLEWIPTKDEVDDSLKELRLSTYENHKWLKATEILERFMNI